MAEVIKYEADRSGLVLKTPCPHGMRIVTEPICVGSVSCRLCWHFVRDDMKNRKVYCKYNENK